MKRALLTMGSWVIRLGSLLLACHVLAVAAQPITFTPPSPNSIDRVLIAVFMGGGAFPASAASYSQTIVGNVIHLELLQDGGDFGPNPPWLANYFVGPLAPGQYAVQFESRQVSGGPVIMTATAQFQVIDVAQTPLRSAVEYFWLSKTHFFMTADPNEIGLLDADHFLGWQRTGRVIGVYAADTPLSPGLSPVCRFYGRPEAGLDSHFFSASPAECQAVIDRFSNAWVLESPNVFLVFLPNLVDGSCPPNTMPVYRLYNNLPDANHHYTTSFVDRQGWMSVGWIPEGYGPNGVAMCAPQQ